MTATAWRAGSPNIVRNCPVILTTGSMTRENALLYHIEMLPKPYELGSAVIRIREVIERHRPH